MGNLSAQLKAEFDPFLQPSLNRPNLEVVPLAGDASSRRYFRIVAGEDSWVLMAWEPFVDDGQYPFLSVRDHFSKHGVHVPQVIAKSPERGLVLLEDLGDLTLERKFWENQNPEHIIPFYKQAIDELIKIHYPATADRNDCVAFKIQFDVEKLLWEMNYGRDHLLVGVCGAQLSDTENKNMQAIFLSICQSLHEEPKFIAHRDYHSRNLMLKLNKMRVIDFQDARLGPVQYDLVSLLRDSYVRIGDPISEKLIGYYLDRRREVGPKAPVSRDEFTRIYELQTIQRCFKACGSFASFYNLRKDTRYLKYIHHTLQTVKNSLEDLHEYQAFLNILTDHGVFERKFEVA